MNVKSTKTVQKYISAPSTLPSPPCHAHATRLYCHAHATTPTQPSPRQTTHLPTRMASLGTISLVYLHVSFKDFFYWNTNNYTFLISKLFFSLHTFCNIYGKSSNYFLDIVYSSELLPDSPIIHYLLELLWSTKNVSCYAKEKKNITFHYAKL